MRLGSLPVVGLRTRENADSRLGEVPAEAQREVVIYTSLDEPDVTPLLKRFEEKSGIKVRAVTDTEATKTTVLRDAPGGGEGASSGGRIFGQ